MKMSSAFASAVYDQTTFNIFFITEAACMNLNYTNSKHSDGDTTVGSICYQSNKQVRKQTTFDVNGGISE